jgi:dTDP-4-amino-4,6-dideoxygalactose transaminase
MKEKLALLGGEPLIKVDGPHKVWPPQADENELLEIKDQRNIDISIKGKTGPIKELEESFLDFLDNKMKYCISFNSGTSALLAAYFAMGIEEDDEVIGPSLTYHAALSPVFFLKGNVVLVDIDKKTRCIDAEEIEKFITKKTKIITVVHQWGHPADMDRIMEIAKKNDLLVLEDCSHAHGSKYKDKMCGTFGDIAIFSLQAQKMIFAGEGGVLVTNNKKYHDRATLLGHYRDRSKEEIKDIEYNKYWQTGFGLKLRMSPFNAVVAKYSLLNYEKHKENRHKCLNYLNKRLEEIDYIENIYNSDHIDRGAWYGFKPLYIKEKLDNLDRKKLIEALRAEGMYIGTPSGTVLATQPLYKDFPDLMFGKRNKKKINKLDDFPNAVDVQENALSLPTFSDWDRDKDIIDQYMLAFKKIQDNIKYLIN